MDFKGCRIKPREPPPILHHPPPKERTPHFFAHLNNINSLESQKQFSDDMKLCNIFSLQNDSIRFYYGIVRKVNIQDEE
jgi:hypothetical protein